MAGNPGREPPVTARTPLAAKNKVGLVLAALLGLAELVLAPATLTIGFANDVFPPSIDEAGNAQLPWESVAFGVAVALITLVVVAYTWLTANRIGARIIAGVLVISMLANVPTFFSQGVDEFQMYGGAPILPFAAAHVLVTVTAVILVLSRPAAPPSPE
jgi:vacuolar-type H+-ATPase subunit I/STV1